MRGPIACFLLCVAFFASPTYAADAAADESATPGASAMGAPEAEESFLVAPVIVDGVPLFRVRGISSYPAERRASEIAARIVAIARDERIPSTAVKVESKPLGSEIVVDSRKVLTVFDDDARLESTERPVLAEAYAQIIAQAIDRYRADRGSHSRIVGASYAIGALVTLAAALYVLLRIYGRINAALERRYRSRLEDVRIKGFKVVHAEHLWKGLRSVIGTVHVLAALTCIYVAFHFALVQFPETRGIAAGLLAAIVEPLAAMGRGFAAAIPKLVFLAILVLVTRYLLTTLQLFFGALDRGSVQLAGFDAEWSWPTYRIVRILVIAFAVVVAYPYIPGLAVGGLQGRLAVPRRDLLVRLVVDHREHHRRILDDLPAGVPRRRPDQGRRRRRRRDRDAPPGHSRALDQERGDRHSELADPQQPRDQLQRAGARPTG